MKEKLLHYLADFVSKNLLCEAKEYATDDELKRACRYNETVLWLRDNNVSARILADHYNQDLEYAEAFLSGLHQYCPMSADSDEIRQVFSKPLEINKVS